MKQMLVVVVLGALSALWAAERPCAVEVVSGVPSDAEVLFDGTSLAKWRNIKGGPASWRIQSDGSLLVDKTGNTPDAVLASIYTRGIYTNFQLHVEYRIPEDIDLSDPWRGNSGIKIFGCYEVQIIDSYRNDRLKPKQSCGAIYANCPPLVNAAQKPGAWQTFDIVFHAPVVEDGAVRRRARFTVLHNGVLVQDGSEPPPYPDKPENRVKTCGDIELQSHNDHSKCISFRNVWIRRLPAAETVETAKWQAAIDAAAERGGGRVVVTKGVHRVGGLLMRSNVELHLEEGAELNAVTGLENYHLVERPYSEGIWSAVVMGVGVTNVAITGKGVINGRGGTWPEPTEEDFKRGCQEGLRPRGIFFTEAKGIRLEDFTLKDSPCWGIVIKACDGVVAKRVKIDSHANWNNDGFDIEARNVLVEDCEADTGDDPFCLKSNDPNFVCENIVFRRCTARGQANAFKIGTATHGLVRNVRYENIRCDVGRRIATKLEDGTPFKTLSFHYQCKVTPQYPTGCMLCGLAFECVDGGAVEDIVVDGMEIVDGVCEPIFIRSDLRKVGRHSVKIKPNTLNRLRNIRISNVRGKAMGPYASAIVGVDGFRIENVVLKDIDITVTGAGEEASRTALETPVPYKIDAYPTPDIFWPHIFPAYGLYVDRADDVRLENVRFRLADGTKDARPEIVRLPETPTGCGL